MGSLNIHAEYRGKNKKITTNLALVSFVEEGIHIIYSPALDLSGYGKTEKEAHKSFEIVFREFIEYTVNKDTLLKELDKHGWKLHGPKKHRNVEAPTFSEMLSTNEDLNAIVNGKSFRKFEQQVSF